MMLVSSRIIASSMALFSLVAQPARIGGAVASVVAIGPEAD